MALKKKKKTLSDYVIKVRIVNDKLKYTDEYQKVLSETTVEWDCPYDYAIQFAYNQSPFAPKKTFLSAAAGDPPKQYKVKKHTGPPLPHKYAIAVFYDGNDSVLTDDPQIIIDDSGGLGGKEPGKTKTTGKKSTKKKAAKK